MRCVMNGGYHDGLEIEAVPSPRKSFPFSLPSKDPVCAFPRETYRLRSVSDTEAIYDFESSEVDWSKVPWENLGG
jgi:hypothetical protein